jgi:hypothetical protein
MADKEAINRFPGARTMGWSNRMPINIGIFNDKSLLARGERLMNHF